jgi:hypothetical protein
MFFPPFFLFEVNLIKELVEVASNGTIVVRYKRIQFSTIWNYMDHKRV